MSTVLKLVVVLAKNVQMKLFVKEEQMFILKRIFGVLSGTQKNFMLVRFKMFVLAEKMEIILWVIVQRVIKVRCEQYVKKNGLE